MKPRIVFSDADGTLVHFQSRLEGLGYKLDATSTAEEPCWIHVPSGTVLPCVAVPSLTLGTGYVSKRSNFLVEVLREKFGVKFVIVTGARTSTLVSRRESGALPRADYDIAEGGGKVWARCYSNASEQLKGNGSEGLKGNVIPLIDGRATAFSMDEAWLDRFVPYLGDWRLNQQVEPLLRQGPLWEVYRLLHRDYPHCKLDASSYISAFLFDFRDANRSEPEFEEKLRSRFDKEISPEFGITLSTNLGKGHVMPLALNKRSAVQYICEKEGVSPSECVALFDDENDIVFAEICGFGIVPLVSHDKVEQMLRTQPQRYHRCRYEGLLGTEEALERILALYQ
jgi:hydroxymethylpyrimidine pyrophosphatase-like HAD family hydrolase